MDLLLDTFQRIDDDRLRLRVYGKPNPGNHRGQGLIDRMKSNSRIKFCGSFRKNVVCEVLSGLDAVILPSIWHENAPLSILEALMAGVPFLASRAEGVADFIEEGRTGLLFDMRSAPAIEKALHEFLEKEPEMRRSCRESPGLSLTQIDHAKILRERIALPPAGRRVEPFREASVDGWIHHFLSGPSDQVW